MGYGINNKMKVIWLCHFTNKYIQKKLNIKKNVPEFAPWITWGIEEAKKRKNIELYVISPHRWLGRKKEFKERNIHYHFFNPGIPIYGRHWPNFFQFDVMTDFILNKVKINRIVNLIQPDIIHLHGLENAYYSSSILQFLNKYPILATIQGFIGYKANQEKINYNLKKRIYYESKIIRKISCFGVRTEEMRTYVLSKNKNAVFFWHEYFLNIPQPYNDEYTLVEKEYDIIFFARITKEKGIEDLIKAIGILIIKNPQIKVAVIGSASSKYINKLKLLAKTKGCLNNIIFFGFVSTQEEIYKILEKSKICVLPTYIDTIPGTIIESMFRRIPVVSYKIGGMPDINKNEEILLLTDAGDITGLSKLIQDLLRSESYRKNIAAKAYDYAIRRWNNENVFNNLISAYKKII